VKVISKPDLFEVARWYEVATKNDFVNFAEVSEVFPSVDWERFIETLTALILQYEEEIDPGPAGSPSGVLRFLMEERGLRQVDLAPILGSKSYVSQILSGHRPISREAAVKLAEFFRVSAHSFL
jgi:HTH-type transcriptional regulator/antitoxin HigA